MIDPDPPEQPSEPAPREPAAKPLYSYPKLPDEYVAPTLEELGLTPPLVVPVTTEWWEDVKRKQAAYAARRARHTEAWFRGGQPEPPTDDEEPGRPRRTGIIHDRRQFRFDF